MTDTTTDNAYDIYGNPIIGEAGDSTHYLDPTVTEYSVAEVFSDTNEFPTFVYTDDIDIDVINFDKKGSTAQGRIADKTKEQLIDYEDSFGINFDSYVKGRHFVLVIDETESDTEPTIGANYGEDKIVLFSGYSRSTFDVDHNSLSVNPKFVGVEGLLDELRVKGQFEYDMFGHNGVNVPPSLFINLTHNLNPCIFNEGGLPNRHKSSIFKLNLTETPVKTNVHVFNNSGLGETEYWSLKNIMDYIFAVYVIDNEINNVIAINDSLSLVPLISKFILYNPYSVEQSDFNEIYPKDFSIEGLTVLEAINKVIEESKKYSLNKQYDMRGRILLGISKNELSERDSTEHGMTIDIGDITDSASKQRIVEEANLNLNREFKNVGRVIVLGDNLHLNTLCTTFKYTPDYPFSSDISSFVAVSTSPHNQIVDFSGHMKLLLAKSFTDEKKVFKQMYLFYNEDWQDIDMGDLGFTAEALNENSIADTRLFSGLKSCKAIRGIYNGEEDKKSVDVKDVDLFICAPSQEKRERTTGGSVYTFPTQKDSSSNIYYFVSPIESANNALFDANFLEDKHSAIMPFEKGGAVNEDTNLTDIQEYVSNSNLVGPTNGFLVVEDNPIPMFIRCTVVADYRIKGIAEIPSFDPDIHETLFVEDRSFKINLSYKDGKYLNGGFYEVADGAIESSLNPTQVLESIQKKAENILSKYTVVQNSGAIPLNGLQRGFKIGDYILGLKGGFRTVPFSAVISGISFDLRQRITSIYLGADHG